MMLLYFFLVISFVWLIFATITDIKKREVPDWLSYSLIGIGIGSRLIYSLIYAEYKILLFGIVGLIACFLFGNLMYYTKQWGGGDAKLLMGLGALFGDYKITSIFSNSIDLPFLVVLIANIFIAGSVCGVIYSIYLAIRSWSKFKVEWRKNKHYNLLILSAAGILIVALSWFLLDGLLKFAGMVIGILVIILSISLEFIKVVEKICMIKFIDTKKLTIGDWIVDDVIIKGKVICKARNIGLTHEDITTLKKYRIKKVLIKEGMPFIPGFLLGFIITIVFGSVVI